MPISVFGAGVVRSREGKGYILLHCSNEYVEDKTGTLGRWCCRAKPGADWHWCCRKDRQGGDKRGFPGGGSGTNNKAEYLAVVKGPRLAKSLAEEGINYDFIVVKSDSKLTVNQLKGEYKVSKPNLKKLWKKARSAALSTGKNVYYNWVRRHYNQRANELAEKAMMSEQAWRKKGYGEKAVRLAKQGVDLVPLSVFRRKKKGWSKLTISEALVYELVENRGMFLREASKELGRKYTTIHTTLKRAEKKVTTL